MKKSNDFKQLEEEAARLAEEFPTLTSALLWVITMIDDHHYKLNLLRDGLVRLSDIKEDPSGPPDSKDILGALEVMRETLDLNSEAGVEDALSALQGSPVFTTNKDDDPTVH